MERKLLITNIEKNNSILFYAYLELNDYKSGHYILLVLRSFIELYTTYKNRYTLMHIV